MIILAENCSPGSGSGGNQRQLGGDGVDLQPDGRGPLFSIRKSFPIVQYILESTVHHFSRQTFRSKKCSYLEQGRSAQSNQRQLGGDGVDLQADGKGLTDGGHVRMSSVCHADMWRQFWWEN